MAQKIKVITADSQDAVEKAVNKYIDQLGESDKRVVIEMAGGVTCAADGQNRLWIATVVLNAPHKRSFEEGDG